MIEVEDRLSYMHACMRVSRGKPGEEEGRRGEGSGHFLEKSNFLFT